MYNNHPDYLFHVMRTVVDRVMPDVLFTHKDPMTQAMQDYKTITEQWSQGNTFTLGLHQRPTYMLWDNPQTPLRLPHGMDYATVAVNGVAVPDTSFDYGHNLLLPFDAGTVPQFPNPYPDDPNKDMRQNYPVLDRNQPSRRPMAEQVVTGMVEEGLRGIAHGSDEYMIEVFDDPDMRRRPIGIFSKSGMQVQIDRTRQGVDRVSLAAKPEWPRPLYVRYRIIPQRLITFRVAARQPGMSDNEQHTARKKPSLMAYTDDGAYQIYAQWFANEFDFDCWAIEPMEAMRLSEELRLSFLYHAGYMREMGISDLVFKRLLSLENMVLPNRDAMERNNYWTRYRVTFFFRTEERHLVPARPLLELQTTLRVESDI